MDAAGPRRSVKERPDVRLSAAGVGQSALLETAAATARTSQPSGVLVHGGVGTGQLQSQIFPDKLFEKRTGSPIRAIYTQDASNGADALHDGIPLPDAQNAAAHAHATAVPKARGRGHGDHYGRADGHVAVVPTGAGQYGGREQTAADRQGATAHVERPAHPVTFRYQGVAGERSRPDNGNNR